MSVVVFGSINMDLVVRTPRFAQPGETLSAHTFFTAPGGKGANQAVAAGRLGVPTAMVGRVGSDMFGNSLLESMQSNGVDTRWVLRDQARPSGTALITVDDRAENTILIVAGANGAVGEDDLGRLEAALAGGGPLLLQLEVPLASVIAAARLARERGIAVILDPAPGQTLPDELYRLVDILTPNESEARILTGITIQERQDAVRAAQVLHERGVGQVIIKMGGQGALWSTQYGSDGHAQQFLPAYQVTSVDTVAAGDAFNGALAAGLSQGLPMSEALRWGMAGGAISTTRPGAQPSMASRQELLEMLAHGEVKEN
jgi:ribokinase